VKMDLTLCGSRPARSDVNVDIHLCAERYFARWLAILQPFGDVLSVHVCCAVMEKVCCVVDSADVRTRRVCCKMKNVVVN
jgi:hypothetical protein